jgi:hypothetical protein
MFIEYARWFKPKYVLMENVQVWVVGGCLWWWCVLCLSGEWVGGWGVCGGGLGGGGDLEVVNGQLG